MTGGPRNPQRLSTRLSPAIVHLTDGSEAFVAHTKTHKNGWLYVVLWDGTRQKYSPQAVSHYQYAPAEIVREGNGRDRHTYQQITDRELIERARQLGAEIPNQEGAHA